MLSLKQILHDIDAIKPFGSSLDQSGVFESSLESLKKMEKKIPPHFIYVLRAFDPKDEAKQKAAASKLLELVLYAQGKLKHDKKAFFWLGSGKVPQSSHESLSSMSQFRIKCEELYKAHESKHKLGTDNQTIEVKLKQNPSDKKLHTKSEKIEVRLSEANTKYENKLTDFLDSLESLVLGIASEKL